MFSPSQTSLNLRREMHDISVGSEVLLLLYCYMLLDVFWVTNAPCSLVPGYLRCWNIVYLASICGTRHTVKCVIRLKLKRSFSSVQRVLTSVQRVLSTHLQRLEQRTILLLNEGFRKDCIPQPCTITICQLGQAPSLSSPYLCLSCLFAFQLSTINICWCTKLPHCETLLLLLLRQQTHKEAKPSFIFLIHSLELLLQKQNDPIVIS